MESLEKHFLIFIFSLAFLTFGSVYAYRQLGFWLEVNNPLQRSQAIVVIGGGFPARGIEAATLFRAGWASEVWLTEGSRDDRDLQLHQFGIPPEFATESGSWLLLKMGVPYQAIRVVPGSAKNTLAELQSVLRYSWNRPPGSLIFVTSKVHSRRVKAIWNTLATKREGIVRCTPGGRYNAEFWWRDPLDKKETLHETLGVLNALAGLSLARE